MSTHRLLEKSVNFIPWRLRDNIRRIPFVAGLQRLLFQRFLAGKEFTYEISAGPAKGLWFPIKLPDDKLIWTGTWEKVVAEAIAENVVPNGISYDIGSHRGFMAGIMALAGSTRVYCFEPNPENLSHLEVLKTLNGKLALEILPYAVAETDGEASFSLMPESSMGKLSESAFQHEAKNEGEILVTVRSLDGLLERGEIEPPSFIKIDVEGAEYAVLQGAESLINTFSPTFVIELHSFALAVACKDFLAARNYATSVIQKQVDLDQEDTFSICHLLATKDP